MGQPFQAAAGFQPAFQALDVAARWLRYRLPREGYRICLVFLKLFERIYTPSSPEPAAT